MSDDDFPQHHEIVIEKQKPPVIYKVQFKLGDEVMKFFNATKAKIKEKEKFEQLESDEDEALKNIERAIQLRENKQQNTDFYYKLTELIDRITVFQDKFLSRQPKFIQKIKMIDHQLYEKRERERLILLKEQTTTSLEENQNKTPKKKKKKRYRSNQMARLMNLTKQFQMKNERKREESSFLNINQNRVQLNKSYNKSLENNNHSIVKIKEDTNEKLPIINKTPNQISDKQINLFQQNIKQMRSNKNLSSHNLGADKSFQSNRKSLESRNIPKTNFSSQNYSNLMVTKENFKESNNNNNHRNYESINSVSPKIQSPNNILQNNSSSRNKSRDRQKIEFFQTLRYQNDKNMNNIINGLLKRDSSRNQKTNNLSQNQTLPTIIQRQQEKQKLIYNQKQQLNKSSGVINGNGQILSQSQVFKSSNSNLRKVNNQDSQQSHQKCDDKVLCHNCFRKLNVNTLHYSIEKVTQSHIRLNQNNSLNDIMDQEEKDQESHVNFRSVSRLNNSGDEKRHQNMIRDLNSIYLKNSPLQFLKQTFYKSKEKQIRRKNNSNQFNQNSILDQEIFKLQEISQQYDLTQTQ